METFWPKLDYDKWKMTYETLHRWVQIVGKIRLCREPWVNHSWSSTLYVTPRGLGTSAIPSDHGNFSIDFDFIDHSLKFSSSDGKRIQFPLQSESVAAFFNRCMEAVSDLGVQVHFDSRPNELVDAIPFSQDNQHCTYVSSDAYTCWQVLVQVNNVFKEFRSDYVGKCSPVHFFWGSFDLAVTRFSGRRAPKHPGGAPHLSDKVVQEAYSHEVSSCGFWPGNEIHPHAAFYSYAYPEPVGFSQSTVAPHEAYYDKTLREFILSYEAVRLSADPAKTLMQFLQRTYEVAATLSKWDRDLLEADQNLLECQRRFGDKAD